MTLAAVLFSAAAPLATIHVAPRGDDRADGSASRPVASLGRAVSMARGGDTIVVKEGEYRITSPVTIGRDKSGLKVVGKGKAILRGGVRIPASLWTSPPGDVLNRLSASAKSNVKVVDLKKLGVGKVPPLLQRGFSHKNNMAPFELFVGDKPQTLARWPNTGYVRTGQVAEAGGQGRSPVFTVSDSRPSRWRNAQDAWVYGYFRWDWADDSIAVSSIRGGRVTLESPHTYGVITNRPFYFENVLGELDTAGEYYIDRTNDRLYFWPSGAGAAYISVADHYLLRVIDGTDVTIDGLRFETSRAVPVEIAGGSGVTVKNSVFRNLGLYGVKIGSGTSHLVQACRFEDLGEGGVYLNGGDLSSLTPAGHAVVDSVFERFMRRARTIRPAIDVNGVGMTVKSNSFTDAPHSAVIFHGNDHVIEDNFFGDLLDETGDGGAVYGGRDWSSRGTQIRNNLFYKIHGEGNVENGVYLDDQLSGTTIEKNAFVDCRLGLMIGGGRDNVVRDNLFYDCDKAMHLDARGLSWRAYGYEELKKSLEKAPYQSATWKRKYPGIERTLQDEPMAPKNNIVTGNVLLNSGRDTDTLEAKFRTGSRVSENASASGSWDVRVNGRTLVIGPRAKARLPQGMQGLARTYGPRVAVPSL